MKFLSLLSLCVLVSSCASHAETAMPAPYTAHPALCDARVSEALDRAPAATGSPESVSAREAYLRGTIPAECTRAASPPRR